MCFSHFFLFKKALNLKIEIATTQVTLKFLKIALLIFILCEVDSLEQKVEGLGMRTDMSYITIVYQDELGGLQVRSKDGQWVDILPCEGTFVVNIGDMLQAWSNDKLRSSEHRVILKKPVSCFSLVFFCCFENEKVILAPDEVVGEENSRIYKPFVFYDYLNFRMNCFSLVFFCCFENEKVILALGCEDGHHFSMYFFLPDAKDGLPTLVNKVSSKSFLLKRYLRYQKVGISEFRTSKFKISFGFEGSNILKGHGVVLSFSGNGLTEMMDSTVGSNFYVCSIFHKLFTEIRKMCSTNNLLKHYQKLFDLSFHIICSFFCKQIYENVNVKAKDSNSASNCLSGYCSQIDVSGGNRKAIVIHMPYRLRKAWSLRRNLVARELYFGESDRTC
ncbi:hypothetical protein P3L10_020518 [Capsicum annuum]